MQLWDSMERRKHLRYAIALPSKEIDLNSCREANSVTRDICEQGVGILLDRELPLDTPVDVCLEMPDNQEKICVRGKIVWVSAVAQNQYRAGICLDKFDLKPILLILRIIKLQLKSRYG